MNFTKDTLKRYAISALVSFITGFAIVLVSQIDNITLTSFTDGTIMGVIFLAVRTGVKGVLELWLSKYGADNTLRD